MTFSHTLVQNIIKYRILILCLVFLSLLFFGYYTSQIHVDNEPMKSVPDNLKEKVDYNRLQEIFPTPHVMIFMAQFEQGTLIMKRDSIVSWAQRFENILVDSVKGIQSTVHIGKIKIPVKGGFLAMKSEYIIPPKKVFSEEKIQKRIHANNELTKSLISSDGTMLSIVLNIAPNIDRQIVVKKTVEIVEEINNFSSIKAYITGATTNSFFIDREMKADFRVLLPLCLLVASLLLYFIYKKVLYVIASLLLTTIALIWTFGIMGWSGIPFSVVTSVIPIIMFPIGVANSIHVLKTYTRIRLEQKKNFIDSFSDTYNELLNPIILTSVTTFIGFGSFVFSEISWTRHFGLFTGIGVMLSLFFTVLLLPIFIYYEPGVKKMLMTKGTWFALSNNFLKTYRTLIFNSPFWITLLIIIIIISIYGGFQVRFESNPIAMFSEQSTIRKSDNLIAEYFGGTRFFYVLLTRNDRAVDDPELWAEVTEIREYLLKNPHIGEVASLLPLLNKTSILLNKKPLSKASVSLLLKGKGLFGKDSQNYVSSWVTEDRRTTKLFVICKNIPGFKYTKLADSINTYITANYSTWDVHVAGPALLIDAMITLLIKTLISSISIAIISVFIVLTLLFRSIKIGFFTTIPMILSTIFVYALMGVFRVPINTVTVIIVNTCIGIGIDYSIHFTAGYMFFSKTFTNKIEALMQTVKIKGAVILFNTFVVGAGFFVLVFSSFPPIRDFGLFIFISMLVSSLFALIFLPICFKYSKSIFK